MPLTRLPNLLRANRRRLALFQDDVAFLLGKQDGRKVSEYELLAHTPNLETALAYEAIFKMPVSDLFPALYAEVEKNISDRAKALIAQTEWSTDAGSIVRRKTLESCATQ
jgi:DNA-binding XRE family transcriptional regulator